MTGTAQQFFKTKNGKNKLPLASSCGSVRGAVVAFEAGRCAATMQPLTEIFRKTFVGSRFVARLTLNSPIFGEFSLHQLVVCNFKVRKFSSTS